MTDEKGVQRSSKGRNTKTRLWRTEPGEEGRGRGLREGVAREPRS